MEARQRIPQLYGYAICLVAVITFLINLAALITAVFDLSDPLHSDPRHVEAPSLASFEIYKVDIQASLNQGQPVPDDATLQVMFEAAKNDRIQSVRFASKRSITISAILIALCFMLFVTHALWLRRLSSTRSEVAT